MRIDHNISDSDSLFARYTFDNATLVEPFSGTEVPGFPEVACGLLAFDPQHSQHEPAGVRFAGERRDKKFYSVGGTISGHDGTTGHWHGYRAPARDDLSARA